MANVDRADLSGVEAGSLAPVDEVREQGLAAGSIAICATTGASSTEMECAGHRVGRDCRADLGVTFAESCDVAESCAAAGVIGVTEVMHPWIWTEGEAELRGPKPRILGTRHQR